MIEQPAPKLSLWPFVMIGVLGDAALIAVGWWIARHSPAPFAPWSLGGMIFCVFAGAALSMTPFWAAYRANARLAESQMVASAVEQIQGINQLAAQISSATAHWKAVQEQATKTVASAGEIAERMATEAKGFSEFMAKANDAERAHLRLEVDKLHRGETEWLQALVRVFDHIFAIYLAGVRSHQPNLREQLGQFQNACRDAIRRLGLTPVEVQPGEPFDAKLHTLVDPEAKPPPGALVGQTLATGFTYQGQLLRPALVALQSEETPPPQPLPQPEPTEPTPKGETGAD